MHKKSTTIFVFCIFFIVSIGIFSLGKIPFLSGLNGVIVLVTTPFQKVTYSVFHLGTESEEIRKLREDNATLQKKLIDQKKLIAEDNALRDQFKTNKPSNPTLLPAEVIGAPGLIPGVSEPDYLVLNLGEKNGITLGQAVVVNDNLIGTINRISNGLSVVLPIQSGQRSFTAHTLATNAMGIVVATGNGGLRLDGVLLSDTLKKDDLVVTKGDVDARGVGIPPDIVVGKIVSIDKRPSALFQTARITPLIDIATIRMVFIVGFEK